MRENETERERDRENIKIVVCKAQWGTLKQQSKKSLICQGYLEFFIFCLLLGCHEHSSAYVSLRCFFPFICMSRSAIGRYFCSANLSSFENSPVFHTMVEPISVSMNIIQRFPVSCAHILQSACDILMRSRPIRCGIILPLVLIPVYLLVSDDKRISTQPLSPLSSWKTVSPDPFLFYNRTLTVISAETSWIFCGVLTLQGNILV